MSAFVRIAIVAAASGAAMFMPSASSATPLASPAAVPGLESMVTQTQSRQRVRAYRGSPRVVYRNRGWNRGAVIGGAAALGVLGAAAAYPYYGGGYACYYQQQPVYDSWGQYIGVQNVRVCP